MLTRLLLWLNRLLNGPSGPNAFRGPDKLVQASSHPPASGWLSELIGDAVIVCDNAGAITEANAPALTLFGADCQGLAALCYSNGQAIPPGQLPLSRVLRTGESVIKTDYHWTADTGKVHILEVSARPLPGGGVGAVFREVTALHEIRERGRLALARQQIAECLCRRLGKAATLEEIGRAGAESVHTLLETLPDVRIRLYVYDSAAQTLTCLASVPECFPQPSKSLQMAQMPVLPFDVRLPVLWQLYVGRQPATSGCTPIDDDGAASVYALPLLSCGTAIGHLSVTSSAEEAFDDPGLLEWLGFLASAVAIALAAPRSAWAAAVLQTQSEAMREIAQLLGDDLDFDHLADLTTGHVRRVTGGEVVTLSIVKNGRLSLVGEAFSDDLLFPERLKPNALVLHGRAIQKAVRTAKTVTQAGITNPAFETGPWRAFAGRAGQHSITAVPLVSGLGVLTVYTNGASSLPETQIKFLETVAALLSVRLAGSSDVKAPADL